MPPIATKLARSSETSRSAISGLAHRNKSALFDHLVGAPGKGEWEGDAEGFGCLQID
jgi:hypothetical protein